MATPGRQPGSSDERKWQDFTPNYESLLVFIDVFYGATLGFGFVLIGLLFDHHFDRGGFDWAPFALLLFANLYLVGDYADARLFTHQYKYQSLKRFIVDLLIGATFFAMFVTAYHASPYFLFCMALALILGGSWCGLLQREGNLLTPKVKPLKNPKLIAFAHVFAGLSLVIYCLMLHWHWHHSWGQRLTRWDVLKAVILYTAWSTLFVAAEWLFSIPSKEADLFPYFPFGRMIRNERMVEIRERIRKRIYRRVVKTLHWISKNTADLENRVRRRPKH